MNIARLSLLTLALATGNLHASECSQRGNAPASPEVSAPAPAHAYYYNPWAELMRMQRLMDLNTLNALPMMYVPARTPAAQASVLQRTEEGYRIDIPLPGFKAEDIRVRLEGLLLTVSAHTSSKALSGLSDEQSSVALTLTLPGQVAAEEMKQRFKDGVLTLTLPSSKNATGSL